MKVFITILMTVKSQTVKISDNGCTVVSAKHFFDEYFVMYSTTSMGAQKKPVEENDGRSLMDLLQPYINLKESEQILFSGHHNNMVHCRYSKAGDSVTGWSGNWKNNIIAND